MKYVRRFVFVHYEDLITIRFKQLEKVTDKLFVFIPSDVENVPVKLVRQMQAMGPDLDWIELGEVPLSVAVPIMSFHIGMLHEKIDLGVEFAILSDDESFDDLIAHIDTRGRTCVRVKNRMDTANEPHEHENLDEEQVALPTKPRMRPAASATRNKRSDGSQSERNGMTDMLQRREMLDRDDVDDNPVADAMDSIEAPEGFADYNAFVTANIERSNGNGRGTKLRQPIKTNKSETASEDDFDARPLADDLVRRLIRSGNRPADLSMLRSYILLHTDDPRAVHHVDDIISQLEENDEVKLKDGVLSYNF